MTRLVWNSVGERLFEAGVDQGVLFVDGSDGVPWNGLLSVSESPTGADVTGYFIDGVKYLSLVSSEEFEATIEAFTYPDEFAQCDGTVSVKNGLYITQQARKPFGLVYRTKVGNDVDGIDHGYKIHIVYNALAQPTERANSSWTETIDPETFSWHIVTKPPVFAGFKQSAHFIIDSRETPSYLMHEIEDILFGYQDSEARLPSVDELLAIFTDYASSTFDAGLITDPEPFFQTFDSGSTPDVVETDTIDGGSP
jgi:hypothetical protein